MTIWQRFSNWLVGISPVVLDFARPVLTGLTPLLVEIVKQEVQNAQLLTQDNGQAKFAKAQVSIRARLNEAKVTVSNSLINAAIELAVSNLPKSVK